MQKTWFLIAACLFLFSCTGTYEQNMAKLDEQYGCDNPHKLLSKRKYKECIAKQRAGGESVFDLSDGLDGLLGKKGSGAMYQNSINPYLWNGSLEVTKIYPLKIADNQGGFIETEWIYDSNNSNQRCLIKIQIKSRELITTGVATSFLCEKKIGDVWSSDNIKYIKEEQQIELKILEVAGNLASISIQ